MVVAEEDSGVLPPPQEAVKMARTLPLACLPQFVHNLTERTLASPQPTMDKPKREAILDLAKYVNERIRVKFTGGREGQPTLSSLRLWPVVNSRASHWGAQGL